MANRVPSMDSGGEFEINKTVYEWSVRAFGLLEKRLGVNIMLHHEEGQLEAGQIFLFNHFARFETIIPHYLIYKNTGAYCRSVAAAELFTGNDALGTYLRNVGAMPTKHPGLLPFLAAEILRGRKVIVFPEGGMVKDRRVMDGDGGYSVFSRSAHGRRKHHRGAAVIALTLEAFKARIQSLEKSADVERLERWVGALGLPSVDALLEAAHRPTLIVPANITFYPIRIDDNALRRATDLLSGGIGRRLSEELLIEGNILFRDTDMDIRLGNPIRPHKVWRWWERKVLDHVFLGIRSLEELFALKRNSPRWHERLFALSMSREVLRVRDAYMHEMYAAVTVNLCHLASRLMRHFAGMGVMEVSKEVFHKALYLAVKCAREESSIHLHRGLESPDGYEGVLDDRCRGLEQFLCTAERSRLIERDAGRYRFLPKLCEMHEFDQIRLENPVLVYANEVAPIPAVRRAVARAVANASTVDKPTLARMLFADERAAYAADREAYAGPRYAGINDQETATESGEPYLLLPEKSNGLGVVLVHGFLASPAELRGFGEKLAAAGHPVIGVRLKGHGTSPWDLRERTWGDWLEPVRRGYRILSAFTARLCVIGFSGGGALALHLAAEHPEGLAAVVAVSAPMRFRDRNFVFVPLVHGLNRLARWVPSVEGVMPFRLNDSEHPAINYRHMPLRGLHELRLMVDELGPRLPEVTCPVMLAQGTGDHVVDPRSAEMILDRLGSREKILHEVPSDRHGILNENIGGIQETVIDYLSSLPDPDAARHAAEAKPADTAGGELGQRMAG